MHSDKDMVAIDKVTKSFGSNRVLDGVSFNVKKGEVVALMGRSGSGKSTLLRCINHLEKIDSGSIRVADDLVGYVEKNDKYYEQKPSEIAQTRTKIGMVFQSFNLFPHMTALGNIIEAPIGVLKKPRAEALARAKSLLSSVGLSDHQDHYPSQLSGGQQQRVAIARSLAMDPHLMLFDEPTSALDPELVGDVLNVMRDLAKQGMTMIVVTHEVGFARDVCDTVTFMHEGTIVESGPPEQVIDNPQTLQARTFMKNIGPQASQLTN